MLAFWPHFISGHIFLCCCSVAKLCLILCHPMNCGTPGLPVHHKLPEFTRTHVHWVGDAIQPSHPLLSPSPPAFSLSQHQGLFQWVSSSHQVAKVLELQPQDKSSQWIFRVDFLLAGLAWSPCSPRASQEVPYTLQFCAHTFFSPLNRVPQPLLCIVSILSEIGIQTAPTQASILASLDTAPCSSWGS